MARDTPIFQTFQWDEDKRQMVLERRGIDFLDAIRIFAGPVLTVPSARRGGAPVAGGWSGRRNRNGGDLHGSGWLLSSHHR